MNDESASQEAAHLELMLGQLAGFRSGELRLDRVLANLEELLDEFSSTDPEWNTEFRDVCEELHARYATALDRQGSVPTAADSDVADAVDQLDRLIRATLEP